jgi:hypothetical protein
MIVPFCPEDLTMCLPLRSAIIKITKACMVEMFKNDSRSFINVLERLARTSRLPLNRKMSGEFLGAFSKGHENSVNKFQGQLHNIWTKDSVGKSRSLEQKQALLDAISGEDYLGLPSVEIENYPQAITQGSPIVPGQLKPCSMT